jgi:ATP-dependent DNA helicase RecQ
MKLMRRTWPRGNVIDGAGLRVGLPVAGQPNMAQEKSMPAYIVFSDAVLRDMARKRPCTPSALLSISGVGDKKLEPYGEVMLSLIRRYCGSK